MSRIPDPDESTIRTAASSFSKEVLPKPKLRFRFRRKRWHRSRVKATPHDPTTDENSWEPPSSDIETPQFHPMIRVQECARPIPIVEYPGLLYQWLQGHVDLFFTAAEALLVALGVILLPVLVIPIVIGLSRRWKFHRFEKFVRRQQQHFSNGRGWVPIVYAIVTSTMAKDFVLQRTKRQEKKRWWHG